MSCHIAIYIHIVNMRNRDMWYKKFSWYTSLLPIIFQLLLQAITKHTFGQWKMKCLAVQGARVNLESLLQKEFLQHYFDSWRNAVTFSNSLRYMIHNWYVYDITVCVLSAELYKKSLWSNGIRNCWQFILNVGEIVLL